MNATNKDRTIHVFNVFPNPHAAYDNLYFRCAEHELLEQLDECIGGMGILENGIPTNWMVLRDGRKMNIKVFNKTVLVKKYKVGDKFSHVCGGKYILARTKPNEIVLIDLEDGNRWSSPIAVNDCCNLTEDDVKKAVGCYELHEFTKIEAKSV